MPTLHVAHSPDSDDAFMFWALAAEKIDTEDRRYIHELADIETLNQRAMKGELEITAVSFHAYSHLADTYALLPHGGSLGDNYGPRIVSRDDKPDDVHAALQGKRIAIPGLLTTAYLTLRLFQPDFKPVVVPFDQIEDAVDRGGNSSTAEPRPTRRSSGGAPRAGREGAFHGLVRAQVVAGTQGEIPTQGLRARGQAASVQPQDVDPPSKASAISRVQASTTPWPPRTRPSPGYFNGMSRRSRKCISAPSDWRQILPGITSQPQA